MGGATVHEWVELHYMMMLHAYAMCVCTCVCVSSLYVGGCLCMLSSKSQTHNDEACMHSHTYVHVHTCMYMHVFAHIYTCSCFCRSHCAGCQCAVNHKVSTHTNHITKLHICSNSVRELQSELCGI